MPRTSNHHGNATAPVIDIHGKAGDDNLPDYLKTPKNGQFWTGLAWGANAFNKPADANGRATFIFRVGMQPGNNYRAVASINNDAMYSGVQTTTPTTAKYLGPETSQTGDAPASPLLTVWRKLWVENDSMTAIPLDTFGYKRNDLSWDLILATIRNVSYSATNGKTSFGIDAISDQTSFLELQRGRIIIQSATYPVTNTASYQVTVAGNHSAIPVNSGFRLYDDDDENLGSDPLPRIDLVDLNMKNYFKTSFVEAVDSGNFNTDKHVPFLPSEDIFLSSTTLKNKKDSAMNDRNSLWVCHLIAAYQGPTSVDVDPELTGEGQRMGETATHAGTDHSTVYVEVCRESYRSSLTALDPAVARSRLKAWIVAVAAHEMGHQPGQQTEEQDHAEGKLMSTGLSDVSVSSPENSIFSPKTIQRFRQSNRWSE